MTGAQLSVEMDGSTVVLVTGDGRRFPIDHDGSNAYHGLVAACRAANKRDAGRSEKTRESSDPTATQPTVDEMFREPGKRGVSMHDIYTGAQRVYQDYQQDQGQTRSVVDGVVSILRGVSVASPTRKGDRK